ncbi:KGW motif small protein [Acinetobacter tandoii]
MIKTATYPNKMVLKQKGWKWFVVVVGLQLSLILGYVIAQNL